MSAYHIWHPHVLSTEPNILEFFLTRAAADSIGKGTKLFAEALLRDIGVQMPVSAWTIDAFRTQYFSEYLGEDDWRDTWQLVWKVRVTGSEPPPTPAHARPWVETNATDDSWSQADQLPDESVIRCIVLADFSNERAMGNARSRIQTDASVQRLGSHSSASPIHFESYQVPPHKVQLQVDLGVFPGEFYAQGAEYAERILQLCQEADGSVNFEEGST